LLFVHTFSFLTEPDLRSQDQTTPRRSSLLRQVVCGFSANEMPTEQSLQKDIFEKAAPEIVRIERRILGMHVA
jgi:hypothetical protein